MDKVYSDRRSEESRPSTDDFAASTYRYKDAPPSKLDRFRYLFQKLKSGTRPATFDSDRPAASLKSILVFTLLSIVAFCGLISMSLQARQYISDRTPIDCNCGASLAEAIAMGCKYDTMAAAWLPDACRDDDLTAQFDLAGTGPHGRWEYWADKNKTQPLSAVELGALGGTTKIFYSTWEWHVAHCFWRWRRQIKARKTMAAHMDVLDGYHHIEHCEEISQADRTEIVASRVGINGSTYS